MSLFAVVYRKASCHALNLVQLPFGEKVNSAANAVAKQVRSVQEEDKCDLFRRETLFGDMAMAFLRKEDCQLGLITS